MDQSIVGTHIAKPGQLPSAARRSTTHFRPDQLAFEGRVLPAVLPHSRWRFVLRPYLPCALPRCCELQVPEVMTDVQIPPEETPDHVHCTIRDSSGRANCFDVCVCCGHLALAHIAYEKYFVPEGKEATA